MRKTWLRLAAALGITGMALSSPLAQSERECANSLSEVLSICSGELLPGTRLDCFDKLALVYVIDASR